ncbi:MAG TPA: FxLYD domain-containing protein [Candidatus Binataceae bacterium]|nr:FxLYD domain-containing protein [Candidatus Binataceae bacterium]
MKMPIGIIAFAALALASSALAAVTVKDNSEAARQAVLTHRLFDHPLTKVVQVKDVHVVISTDQIMRSCCMPPSLLVAGNVVNVDSHPINYVKLIFSFEDKNGKVVHAETIYNAQAVSMGEDAEVRRILNEKPHFDPLKPGATDQFSFEIPMPLLPRFTKVELYPDVVTQ